MLVCYDGWKNDLNDPPCMVQESCGIESLESAIMFLACLSFFFLPTFQKKPPQKFPVGFKNNPAFLNKMTQGIINKKRVGREGEKNEQAHDAAFCFAFFFKKIHSQLD